MSRCTLLVLAAALLFVRADAQKDPGPADQVRPAKDFKVDLLYRVPADKQGSWVALTADPKGRLIVSDQYGGLFRVTPPPPGKLAPTSVEPLPVKVGMAQGLLWAFDSLYVVVNGSKKGEYSSGLYRVTASKQDDRLDKVELLRRLEGHNGGGLGEHGPHAVLLTPDKKNLVVVCGNQTALARPFSSRVPELWGEDHLLERMPDGNGFMANVLGPGGAVYQVSPDGKDWSLLSVGFRNQYDAAFNRDGELFTYDADMEWDMNTPWYRPTRVNHVTSGSEFGWRNGAGKWPAYYLDSLAQVVNVGPGSPTGVTFGYGAKFPLKYQEALFICDWSYGKLYAVHLTPRGASYEGVLEEFVSGTPLPLTDLVVNPIDGALYFAVGGRRTQSGLYRVTYVGKESTAPPKDAPARNPLRELRQSLEAFHKPDAKAVEAAWPHLDHEDRHVRFAARVALEHQDPKSWAKLALAEKKPAAALPALLALTRASASCPKHAKTPVAKPPVEAERKAAVFDRLLALGGEKLNDDQLVDLARVWHVALSRMGPPSDAQKAKLTAQFDALYPAGDRRLNAEVCALLVYLEAPSVVGKTLKLLADAPTQEEQLEYARSLRVLKTGWTLSQRREFFAWLLKAANFRGGNSMRGFWAHVRRASEATLTAAEKRDLKAILEAKPPEKTPIVGKPRPFVKQYKTDELVTAVEKGLKTKRDFDKGRRYFAEARCFVCHRFDSEGGSMGPDLTGLSGRFGVKDLLTSIVEPSKEISDQYAAVEVSTNKGRTITGRIVNLNNDNVMINTDMEDPNAISPVRRRDVLEMKTSKLSMMPAGLLDTFTPEEVADLMAYLLSRGDRRHKMFE